jgi:hypothetical protein
MTTRDSIHVHVVAYALWPSSSAHDPTITPHPWAQALQALPLHPSLETLGDASLSSANTLPANSPCCAHESALAQAMGWSVQPDQLPMAAWHAARMGLSGEAGHGWAFIDLVHCEFNQGRIRISPPSPLNPDDSLAFMQAMQPFFEEDGIRLYPFATGRFLAHAPVFQSLPCVSLERACLQDMHALHDIEQLSEQTPAQRLLRRLQNEMQMLLYTHALNAKRPQPINSFWVSGCGPLPSQSHSGVHLHTQLRDTYLQHDPTAWASAFAELALNLMAPALQRGDSVILCGVDRSLTLKASAAPWWQHVWRKIRPRSWVKQLS